MDDYGDDVPFREEPLLSDAERRAPVTMTIAGYEAGAIDTMVARMIYTQCHEQIQKAVQRALEKVVGDAVRESAAAQVAPVVAKCIEEGWQKTDGYGAPSGPRKHLADLVREYLTARDSYGNRGTNIEGIANKAIEEGVKNCLAEETAKLKAKFSAMVDDVLKAKFSQLMREAIGLKS